MTDELRHADHERLRDDLAAYALGALPADEATELERHLESCESCRARLRWLSPAIDLLPAAVPQEAPPESLRARLMETVTAEAAQASAAGEAVADRSAVRRSGPRSSGWRAFLLRPATGLAAVALIAAGAGAGFLARGEGDEAANPPTTFVEADPLGGAVGVSATLERHGDSATLHVNELPPLDRGHVYEVWIQRAGVPEPASLFVLDRNGAALAAVPGPLHSAEKVLVTREPRGGSQRPTTPPLLEAAL